jgi:hypothetical protein
MAVIRVNAHQMNIVTVTAPDFIDYEPYHVKLMARNEIAGAAKNVASIYKNAAPYGSIERKARLNVGKFKPPNNSHGQICSTMSVRLITEPCFSTPRVILKRE